jgi:predicted RNA binding protein with dsRBD fold (UPF0201 family)
MDIKKIIEDSELLYTVSNLIDEESLEQMVDELSEKIMKEASIKATLYHLHQLEMQRSICETKKRMVDDGWKNLSIDPNTISFIKFCKKN